MPIRRKPSPAALAPLPDPTEDSRDWRLSAACIGLPEHAVLGTDRTAALPALAACEHCPIIAPCLAIVDPEHTWFDGVSGGRLWRNGREVTVRSGIDTPEEQS
ncbi:hypothetical protein ACIBSV_14750 [Embleya sp. NPDC050154]|uniref:hypothetical protein n=1 Tax=Embleya sp. NPDC050154 TaxID=3363988 RepID=UPI0037A89199